MTIERRMTRFRGTCTSYDASTYTCTLRRTLRHEKVFVCSNCPAWPELDVLYESITGREVEPTYLWWRNEWIKYNIPYAKERMEAFVETHTQSPSAEFPPSKQKLVTVRRPRQLALPMSWAFPVMLAIAVFLGSLIVNLIIWALGGG